MPKSSQRGTKTYHSKLITVFAAIAAIVSAIVIIAGIFIEQGINDSIENSRKSLEEVSFRIVSSTMRDAADTIVAIARDSNAARWAQSEPGSSEYYYDALLLYKELRRLSPVEDSYSYTIAATSQNQEAFVITSSGTIARKAFLSSLDAEGLSSVQIEPGIYRSRDGSTLILVVNRYVGSGTLQLFILIPYSIIGIPDEGGIEEVLLDEAQHRFLTGSESIADDLSFETLSKLPDGEAEVEGYTIRKESFPDFRTSLLYIHEAEMFPITAFIIATPLIFLAIIIAYLLQESLYRPIRTAYESVRDESGEEGNELDTIIAKCKEAEGLNEKLEQLSSALQAASDTQKYRAYLLGSDTPARAEDDGSAYYAVAVIAADDERGERRITSLLRINSMTAKVRHLHFILMDDGSATLICKGKDEEETYSFLYRCLKEYVSLDETVGMQAAISSPAEGWQSIRASYRKARKIMGFRHLWMDKAILTEAEASMNANQMIYPISEERKLINAALSASPSTLEIFDETVRSNTMPERLLPESEYRQLATALTSTVLRIFQETNEEEGRAIDWQGLREGSDPGSAISTLRSLLAAYIGRKTEENEARYSKLVEDMKEYIRKHYSEPIMLVDLSEEFNLSPKYCSEIFNRLSGDTFKNYLNRFRINEAQHIIDGNSDIRITELATMVGFSSSNTFIRVFDKYMGTTPKQYADSVSMRRSKA